MFFVFPAFSLVITHPLNERAISVRQLGVGHFFKPFIRLAEYRCILDNADRRFKDAGSGGRLRTCGTQAAPNRPRQTHRPSQFQHQRLGEIRRMRHAGAGLEMESFCGFGDKLRWRSLIGTHDAFFLVSTL
jgi:hypothetical protein